MSKTIEVEVFAIDELNEAAYELAYKNEQALMEAEHEIDMAISKMFREQIEALGYENCDICYSFPNHPRKPEGVAFYTKPGHGVDFTPILERLGVKFDFTSILDINQETCDKMIGTIEGKDTYENYLDTTGFSISKSMKVEYIASGGFSHLYREMVEYDVRQLSCILTVQAKTIINIMKGKEYIINRSKKRGATYLKCGTEFVIGE